MGTEALRLLIISFPQGLSVSYIDKFSVWSCTQASSGCSQLVQNQYGRRRVA